MANKLTKEELNKLRNEIAFLQGEKNALEDTVAKLTEDISALKVIHGNLSKQIVETSVEVNRLIARILIKKEQLANTEIRMNNVISQHADILKRKLAIEKEYKEMPEQLTIKRAEVASVQKEIEMAKVRLDAEIEEKKEQIFILDTQREEKAKNVFILDRLEQREEFIKSKYDKLGLKY